MAIDIVKPEPAVRRAHWPRSLACVVALGVGAMLVFMGGGHLYGVTVRALAEGLPFDYRLVSLLATGGIVAYPGLTNLALARWLWLGRDWAFAMCAANAAVSLAYLLLLLAARTRPDLVGRELPLAIVIVGTYVFALVSLWVWHRSAARPGVRSGR